MPLSNAAVIALQCSDAGNRQKYFKPRRTFELIEMNNTFEDKLAAVAKRVNERLVTIVTTSPLSGEIQRPETLVNAMRHGLLNGGKRLRPFLVVECAALFNVPEETALTTACALECLHSYSLIHDDLPAMDDDDLRRGQPTVHKAYDEAMAILAGDALLTLAFDLITDEANPVDGNIRATLAALLARAAGLGGMIGGQVLDIAAEKSAPNESEIRTLQAMKTGALITFACEAGAVLGNASSDQRMQLKSFGETIGFGFQLADDLLDVTSSAQEMGKAVGKDADKGKGTLVGIHGVQAAQSILEKTVQEAVDSLSSFCEEATTLREAARFIMTRSH